MSTTYNECSDFWDRFPCNARHGDRAMTDAEYFAQVRAKKNRAEPHILPFMEPKKWGGGGSILDVGCGLGTQAVWFAQAHAFVTATDFSEVSLEMALRHSFAANVADYVIVKKRDYDTDFFPQYAYDLIWAWGSLHHMRSPGRVLRNLRAHNTHPRTKLKLMVYHRNSTKAVRLRLQHGHRWRHFTEASGPVPVSDAYSLSGAIAMVELAGWKVETARVAHIFPWKVKPYLRGEFVKGLPWRWVPPGMFAKMEERWGFHILIEARPSP